MVETKLETLTLSKFFNTETRTLVELPDDQEISAQKSRMLRYAYRDGALSRNTEALGKKDSTSVWVSRETLLKLAEICDGKPTPMGNEGVQIHWATYPKDYPDTTLAGRQTIVIQADVNSWFGDYVPCPAFCGTDGGLDCSH